MTIPSLKKWMRVGVLHAYLPLREPRRKVLFSFVDAVFLEVTQALLDCGLPSGKAFAWSDAATRGELRPPNYNGAILISRGFDGSVRFEVVKTTGKDATDRLAAKAVGIYVDLRWAATRVIERLIKGGSIAGPFQGNFAEALTRQHYVPRAALVRAKNTAAEIEEAPARSGKAAGPSSAPPTPSRAPPPSSRPPRRSGRAPK